MLMSPKYSRCQQTPNVIQIGGVMFLKNSRRLRCSLAVQESLAEVSMFQMSACTLKKVICVTNIKAPATTNQMVKITHTNNEADYKDQGRLIETNVMACRQASGI